jgi:hypothetical protein
MEAYKRNITIKLLLLRIFFLVAVTASIFFFLYKRNDYGFVIDTLLLFCSIIPITELKIDKDSFTIIEYYLFGFISRKQMFLRGDDVSIEPFDFTFSDEDANNLITSSFLDLFLFSSKATLKKFIVKEKNSCGNTIEFKLKLSDKEYSLIKNGFTFPPIAHLD